MIALTDYQALDAQLKAEAQQRAGFTLPPGIPDAAERRLMSATRGLPVTPRPTAMPYVMNAELAAAWPAHVANGNPFVTYGHWNLNADPSWWVYRSVFTLMPAYWQTGEQRYLDEALSDHCLPPDVTQGQQVPHLHEIGYLVQHQLLKPYDPSSEWERRILALGEHMKGHYRIGDLDQCLTYQEYFKNEEKHYGGSHAQADIEDYLTEYFEKTSGGAFDSSSAYQRSTAQLKCWGAAAYGKDIFPWFDRWATEFAEFCRRDLSGDLKAAAWWGDQGATDDGKVTPYHRVHLLFLLAGLGYDPDGMLKSIARRMMHPDMQVENPPPQATYPYGNMGFQFVCDPGEIMAAKPVPLPDGGHIAEIGVVTWRKGDNFVQAYLPTALFEDHHFKAYTSAAQQYKAGQHVNTMPGGYYPENSAANANAIQIKHLDWFYGATFDGGEITEDGFTARCSAVGPWEMHRADDSGIVRPPLPTDFAGVERSTTISYSETNDTLRYVDRLLVPSGPFPVQDYWAHYPMMTRTQHAIGEIKADDDGWVWGDRRLRAVLRNAAGKTFPLTGKIEQRGRLSPNNDYDWWRLAVQTPVELPPGEYTLTTAITPVGAPVPEEPPPKPPPVEPPPPTEPPSDILTELRAMNAKLDRLLNRKTLQVIEE